MSLATEQEILSRVARELLEGQAPEGQLVGGKRLGGDAVRLWLVRLDDASVHDALTSVLSADEMQRAMAYPSATRARRFVRLRGVLRLLLAELTDRTPGAVHFAYGRDGKPSLAPSNHSPALHFNVSHARDYALVAVAQSRRVGVDLAWTEGETRVAHVAQRFFSASERAALAGVVEGARRDAFWRIWVRKEAYLKGRGEGISEHIYETDFSAVVRTAARKAARAEEGATQGEPRDQDRWTFVDVAGLPDGYVGSVALEHLAS